MNVQKQQEQRSPVLSPPLLLQSYEVIITFNLIEEVESSDDRKLDLTS